MTTARLVMAVAMLTVVLGCSSGGSSGGEAAGSCAGVVTHENRDYLPTQDEDFTVGERLGTARIPECDDTPNDPEAAIPDGTTNAYSSRAGTPPRPSPSVTRPPRRGSWRSAEHTPKRDRTDPPALRSRFLVLPRGPRGSPVTPVDPPGYRPPSRYP